MKVTEVTVTKGRTIKVGNFNMARYDYGMTAKLDADDDVGVVTERLQTDVDKLVDDETKYWENEIENSDRR